MTYQRRIVDDELDELLPSLSAIALEGPRGVGKTATGSRRAERVYTLDDPAIVELIEADVSQVDSDGITTLIDEWQRHPPVWDHVRRRVDSGAKAGSYLLAGSAVPADAPTHSGAGRIVSLRMRPLSLAERDLQSATVSLREMLADNRADVTGTTTVALSEYVEEIVASGLPGIRPLTGRARRAQLDGYLQRVVQRDFPEQGQRVRRPATLRAWLTAYAAATATTTSYNTLLDAATAGETDKPAKTTTIVYRDVLSQLWLLDPVPGWVPGGPRVKRLTEAPKHNLTDPALAARLLGVDADALLTGRSAGPDIPRHGTLLGALFESLVTLSVRTYAQANEATVHHLRTRDERQEVDLIVEREDQRVVAFEVKLTASPDSKSVRHLVWLRQQLGDDLLDAAVITTGQHAYRRADGIAVIPAALLGP